MRLLPNTRLKLAAPALVGYGFHRELPCASIPFVETSSLRRSLSAIR